jgi:alpha-tubulin suppressor-like RCC1 family protein
MNNKTNKINKDNGELYTFGYGVAGELGFGDYQNVNKPKLLMKDLSISKIAVGGLHTLLLKNDGSLFVFGNKSQNFCNFNIFCC